MTGNDIDALIEKADALDGSSSKTALSGCIGELQDAFEALSLNQPAHYFGVAASRVMLMWFAGDAVKAIEFAQPVLDAAKGLDFSAPSDDEKGNQSAQTATIEAVFQCRRDPWAA